MGVLTPSQTTADGAGYYGGDTVKTAYNIAALDAFRANNVFKNVADVKWDESGAPQRGNPVTFTITSALAVATSALTEDAEPTPTKVADTQKSITLVEYGNAVKESKKVRKTSFINMDMNVAKEVAANMEESVDILARDALSGGTNVLYGPNATSRGTVATTSLFTAQSARRLRAYLAGKNARGVDGQRIGGNYVSFIHPDVNYDLRADSTALTSWLATGVYGGDASQIINGEVGMFDGIRFVENANCKMVADAGVSSTVDVYITVVAGAQALGIAVGEAEHMVISGPFDDLQRFLSIGWYALLGFGRIRENSLVRYESCSSLGANT